MKKTSIIAALAEQNGISQKEATANVNSVFEIISNALKSGEEVQIADFGVFKITERAARAGRNPQTGEPIQIAASKGVKFSSYSALKAGVNK
ncbi:HU family DNA-binding protein [Photobacterium damselae]|uniref:HU family DNA-binding protein n=1 Tax=Photobacterium damselae TaxID=38293 RepID=UPI001F1AA9F4|nr:HU family DNA-binding protein [Photobacterium damselae]UKA04561.1 HU family DNA-binding protein [Photobacterium damselae subsp. damselae]